MTGPGRSSGDEHGFGPAHPLIVRPLGDGYQIIAGHYRVLATEQVGLKVRIAVASPAA